MHFKKANLFGKFVKEGWCVMDHTHRASYNFCDFMKAIAWGLLWTFVIFYIAGWFLVFGIAPWLLYFFSDFPIPWATDTSWGWNLHVSASIFGGGVIIVALFGTLAYCEMKLKEWAEIRRRRKDNLPPAEPTSPTWFQEAREAFHKKYCPLVTFEE